MRSLLLVLIIIGTISPGFAAMVTIQKIQDRNTLYASGASQGLSKGQVLAIKSQDEGAGVIGYARVSRIETAKAGLSQVWAELVWVSKYSLVRPGDHLVSYDLSTQANDYQGATELLVREYSPGTSARFKPLFTQGIAIGETAQTLWSRETLITWYGHLHYGLTDWLTISTLLPGDIGGAFNNLDSDYFPNSPNAGAKIQFVDSAHDSVASGLTFGKMSDSDRWILNWNLMWDSHSNEKMISHTFVTLAIYSIEKAEETTAVKSAGTSSFQTGYEYILDDWGRVLFGPNYNFETKTIGGYLAYVKIWDHFHLEGTLYSVNVRNPKWSVTEGYFAYLDAYWRF